MIPPILSDNIAKSERDRASPLILRSRPASSIAQVRDSFGISEKAEAREFIRVFLLWANAPRGLKLAIDENGTPYFEDARLVIIAKKVYVQEMEREKILDDKYLKGFYSEDGIHTIYIGKAEKVLVRE